MYVSMGMRQIEKKGLMKRARAGTAFNTRTQDKYIKAITVVVARCFQKSKSYESALQYGVNVALLIGCLGPPERL